MKQYPDYAIERLQKEYDRLEEAFARIWGALSPTNGRDEIMWHIISAKRLIYKIITENKEETTNDNNTSTKG